MTRDLHWPQRLRKFLQTQDKTSKFRVSQNANVREWNGIHSNWNIITDTTLHMWHCKHLKHVNNCTTVLTWPASNDSITFTLKIKKSRSRSDTESLAPQQHVLSQHTHQHFVLGDISLMTLHILTTLTGICGVKSLNINKLIQYHH